MSKSESHLPARPSIEQLRKQAKELLRSCREGDVAAMQRVRSRCTRLADPANNQAIGLADVQFTLARELGFENWSSLVHYIQALRQAAPAQFDRLAQDYLAAYGGDLDALARLNDLYGRLWTVDQHRQQVQRCLQLLRISARDTAELGLTEVHTLIARECGFENWGQLADNAGKALRDLRSAPLGLSSRPPYYRIDWDANVIEPRPPLSDGDWDTIVGIMQEHGITGINAQNQMTDAALERLSRLEHVTRIEFDGSNRVTDRGFLHLAGMTQLEQLDLSGYHSQITDQGLAVLRQLPNLRRFKLCWPQRITDAGIAHLEYCDQLEIVDLLGTRTGDGAIRALAGKRRLRSFKSGEQLTDSGLGELQGFPAFRTWQGGNKQVGLMAFNPDSNFLLIRGSITDKGLAQLAGLAGLFALNIDDRKLAITGAGLATLAELPHLGWLGFDATDETMPQIAAMPHLRMLMCQDTVASDVGFAALSRSQTIEYIWGRRCHNLEGRGFTALAKMPALRGLVVSCKNVNDKALSALPSFPALKEFMPMDVLDEGFRHVGRCQQLEELWCMYCTETGDAATRHLAGLNRLKRYSAYSSQITDQSLELLGSMPSLESLYFEYCAALTDAGVSFLGKLPRLRELSFEGSPLVTRAGAANLPVNVRVSYQS